jgi:ATP-dependent RNA helicase DeaD
MTSANVRLASTNAETRLRVERMPPAREGKPRRSERIAPAPTFTPGPAPVPEPSKLQGGAESRKHHAASTELAAPKASRRTPGGQTRLYMNLGSQAGIAPRDIVGAIMGETGLPPEVVGTIDIRERHLFADVASEHANAIIAKLNRTRIKDQRVKVKVA